MRVRLKLHQLPASNGVAVSRGSRTRVPCALFALRKVSITIPARVRRVLHWAFYSLDASGAHEKARHSRLARGRLSPSAGSLPGLGPYLPASGPRQFLTRLSLEYYAGDIGFITSVASTVTINSEKLCPPARAIRPPRGMILLVRRDANAVTPLPNFRGK